MLDEWLRDYERPCLSHELGVLVNFLDLDLEHRYGRFNVKGLAKEVKNGETVNLRLYGYAANNDASGHTLAVDDITIMGTVQDQRIAFHFQ